MLETRQEKNTYPFLQGGGEMGELTRNYDWSTTSVGSPGEWPQSLKTTVSNILRSKFPMFLWWGEDMIQFYNDAYRPSMGNEGKHPSALGAKGADTWPEIWAIISPLMLQVETTGEATWMENQLVPIYRNGKIEDVYWTYSYSSVLDDEGKHGGILVTCMETTEAVMANQRIEKSQKELLQLFDESPVAIATISRNDDLVFEYANPFYGVLVGRKPEEIVGKPLLEALPEITEQGFDNLLNDVIQTGNPFIAAEVAVDILRAEKMETIYVDLTYQPRTERDGSIGGVLVVATDVTEQIRARKIIEESEAKYRTLFESMDQGYCTLEIIFEGDRCVDYRYLETNPTFERHLGMANALGKTIREIAPGIEPKWFDFYGGVALTGNPIRIEEESKAFNKWFEVYAVRVGRAEERKVGVFFTDVTERKASELLLKENEALLRTVFDAAPNSLTVYEEVYNEEGQVEDFKFVMANEFTIRTTGRADLVGKRYSQEFPHARETGVLDKFIEVATTGIPADFEKWYEGEGMRHWFLFIVNKVGKLLVVTTEDITKRKEAEKTIQESEAKFRTMAESTPVLITVGDETGDVTYFNKAWTALTGRPSQDLLQMGWTNIIYEEDRERFIPVFLDAFAIKAPFTGEFRVLNATGEPRWLMADGVPRFDTGGNFMGYISACTDITQNKVSQQQLQTALEQVRLSKEAAELGTFDMDLERGTMHWDDRCRTLFGISHHEPVTYEKDFAGGLHPDDRDRILKLIDQAFNKSISNGEYDVEYRTIGAEDGVIRWVRAKGKVYFDSNDKPARFIGSVLDITDKVMAVQRIEALVEERTKELAKANEALQQINKELQRSNQNLEEFAHAASHDLKEPIRKIHFFTHQLREQLADRLKEAEVRSFGRIENASQRMGNLIDDLLLYSHVSQRPHDTESVDLNEKLKRVLEDLDLDIEEKGATVNIGKLPVVQGYRRQLQQLIQNLLSNSLKYSKADVPPVIEITAENVEKKGKHYHLIKVTDNGIGFPQEYREKIFQMFARLHGRAEYSGTGVGLSIVKKVVENHNGFIEVYSAPGEGASFQVYLPKE
jgi:PAS domain S-box-containing protein